MFYRVLNTPLNNFEIGNKKSTTIFQAGKYTQHMLIFFTDSRLDMLMSVMVIKNMYLTTSFKLKQLKFVRNLKFNTKVHAHMQCQKIYLYSTRNPLIVLMSAFVCKNSTFTKSISMRAVLWTFQFCFRFFKTKG